MSERVSTRLEDLSGANEARFRKIRVNKARRFAKKQGLSLRESDRGFSLVDSAQSRVSVEDRSHLTLNEVESYLARV